MPGAPAEVEVRIGTGGLSSKPLGEDNWEEAARLVEQWS